MHLVNHILVCFMKVPPAFGVTDEDVFGYTSQHIRGNCPGISAFWKRGDVLGRQMDIFQLQLAHIRGKIIQADK